MLFLPRRTFHRSTAAFCLLKYLLKPLHGVESTFLVPLVPHKSRLLSCDIVYNKPSPTCSGAIVIMPFTRSGKRSFVEPKASSPASRTLSTSRSNNFSAFAYNPKSNPDSDVPLPLSVPVPVPVDNAIDTNTTPKKIKDEGNAPKATPTPTPTPTPTITPKINHKQHTDLTNRTVVELKEMLRGLGLKVGGNKKELVFRLLEAKSIANVNAKAPKLTSADKAQSPMKKEEPKSPKTPQKQKPSTQEQKRKTPKSKTTSGRKRQRIEPGSLPLPKNYELVYSLVEELRADRTAPLDTDGGEALPQRHLGDKVYRYQVLIALMLSSQTKDAVVGESIRALQEHGLDVETIGATDPITLNSLIRKVGFHNNKTKYIKNTTDILKKDYDGDIPPTAEAIMKLPGVGPKMAYIVENIAFGMSTGIGVDTHMHRIFNELKWVTSKTPEGTREQLEGWLPKEKWSNVNMLWVGFGQESQQQKEKMLKKALACSKPVEALKLLKKVGLDVLKEGKKFGLEEEIKKVH